MVTYIKDKHNRFAGSIGDGKSKIPVTTGTPRPAALPDNTAPRESGVPVAHERWQARIDETARLEAAGDTTLNDDPGTQVWGQPNEKGHLARTTTFRDGRSQVAVFEPSGEYTEMNRVSEKNLLNGEGHDLDENTPALRSWENGVLALSVHMQHGLAQDPASGQPAIRAFTNGEEVTHMHYSGGKQQDPKPGVPALVHTMRQGDTIITRSTYVTQGVATKEEDVIPLDVLGETLFVKSTRTAE